MTYATSPGYRHTQKGPWWLLLVSFGAYMLVMAWLTWDWPTVPLVPVILLVSGILMVVLGACFQHLTVADEADRLAIRFGPLPLFAKRIRYEDMTAAELARTTLLDGWGIHRSLRGGWVWNIWGWECVVIRHGGTTYVGTDDAEGLLRFLKTKLPALADAGKQP